MRDTLPEYQTRIAKNAKDTIDLAFSGCVITITEEFDGSSKPLRRKTVIDLSLIDPSSISAETSDWADEPGVGIVTLVATNDRRVITETTVNRETNEQVGKPYVTAREYLYTLGRPYADRFVKAAKNAVTLCQGKPSTF
jgi:hypothetical protein